MINGADAGAWKIKLRINKNIIDFFDVFGLSFRATFSTQLMVAIHLRSRFEWIHTWNEWNLIFFLFRLFRRRSTIRFSNTKRNEKKWFFFLSFFAPVKDADFSLFNEIHFIFCFVCAVVFTNQTARPVWVQVKRANDLMWTKFCHYILHSVR